MLSPQAVLANVRMPHRSLTSSSAAPAVESDAQGYVPDYGTVAAYLSASAVGTLWLYDKHFEEWVVSGESTTVSDKTFDAANKLGYWTAAPGAKAYIQLDTDSLTIKHNLSEIPRTLGPN